MREQKLKETRAAHRFDSHYDWQMTHDPDWVYAFCRFLIVPIMRYWYRLEGIDTENLPQQGPVIIACNHASNLDHFTAAVFSQRPVRFLAKSQLFKPIASWILRHGGAIPLLRGHGDDRWFPVACSALKKGQAVVIYFGGGRWRPGKGMFEKAHRGVSRMAYETGAPVVPVAIVGTERLRNWKRGQIRPRIFVVFGERMHFECEGDPTKAQLEAAAVQIMNRSRAMYEVYQPAPGHDCRLGAEPLTP